MNWSRRGDLPKILRKSHQWGRRIKMREEAEETSMVSWKNFKKGEISYVGRSSHIQEGCSFQRSAIIWATMLVVLLTLDSNYMHNHAAFGILFITRHNYKVMPTHWMLLCKTCLTLLKFIPFWHQPTLTRGLPNSFWCHPESWCFPEHLLCVVYWFHLICFSPKTESSNRIRTTFALFPRVLYVTSTVPGNKSSLGKYWSPSLSPLCVVC